MRQWGCFNRPPLKTTAVVQSGWFMDGYTRVPRMVSIPEPMTKSCQYTQGNPQDPACQGCNHHKDKQ